MAQIEKGSFLIGLKYKKQIDGLSDESAGKLLKALMAHEMGETCKLNDGGTEMLYSIMADEQDENRKKYEEKCKSKQESGAMGGLAKAAKAKSEKESLANVASASCANKNIANLHDNDCDYESDREKEHKEFCTEPFGFDSFWSAYPRKVGKGNARKSWLKIGPGQELLTKILSAVERDKKTDQWQREGGRFIPHPATWLNQERWEDEPDTVPPPDKPPEPFHIPNNLPEGKTWADVYGDHPVEIGPDTSWEDLVE